MIPTKVFFTKGVGKHKERLASFEAALRDAGIAFCNLVYVSSILPPHCQILPRKDGLKKINPGQIIYCVMARNESNEPNRLVASAIGCAVHSDVNQHGYLSEHHSFGQTDSVAGEYAEDLAASMLASTIGIKFDTNVDYDKRKEVFRLDGRIVRTFNVTQSARVDKNGLWTTVIAVAVFLFE
jgi:arginine decarboxylase